MSMDWAKWSLISAHWRLSQLNSTDSAQDCGEKQKNYSREAEMGRDMRKKMTRPVFGVALLAGGLVLAIGLTVAVTATRATAGPIERACMGSDRRAASPALCSCIQRVADMTLKGGDQRRASKFFRDPDAAHATWMSKRDADDAFWERYKSFGQTAQAYCGG